MADAMLEDAPVPAAAAEAPDVDVDPNVYRDPSFNDIKKKFVSFLTTDFPDVCLFPFSHFSPVVSPHSFFSGLLQLTVSSGGVDLHSYDALLKQMLRAHQSRLHISIEHLRITDSELANRYSFSSFVSSSFQLFPSLRLDSSPITHVLSRSSPLSRFLCCISSGFSFSSSCSSFSVCCQNPLLFSRRSRTRWRNISWRCLTQACLSYLQRSGEQGKGGKQKMRQGEPANTILVLLSTASCFHRSRIMIALQSM